MRTRYLDNAQLDPQKERQILTMSLSEIQETILNGAISIDEVALVHLKKAYYCDRRIIGDAQTMKRLMENIIPSLSQKIARKLDGKKDIKINTDSSFHIEEEEKGSIFDFQSEESASQGLNNRNIRLLKEEAKKS